ncbi:hypothetical protein WL56_22205 [Burkholderia cepacia]|nr:hypothetical protein WL56_22205 [Burkholderia cepacia]
MRRPVAARVMGAAAGRSGRLRVPVAIPTETLGARRGRDPADVGATAGQDIGQGATIECEQRIGR